MAGELSKELRGAGKKREKERKAKIKHTKELKTHNKKQWLREERELAEKIIAGIPSRARKEEESGKKRLSVFSLTPEFLRGESVDTLDGAGQIVYDWCVEEGFSIELNPLCKFIVSMEIFW